MEDCAHARIPSAVVPYKSETSDAVKIDVVELEVAERETAVCDIARTPLIRQCHGERTRQQPVMGKHPVVGISSADRNIRVFHLAEHQRTVDRRVVKPAAHPVGNDPAQFLPVYIQTVAGISDADQRASRRMALYRALAEGRRIRKASVVEDIIQIEAFDGGGQPAEPAATDSIRINLPAQIQLSDFVIISRLSIIDVKPYHRTVQAQIIFLPGAVVSMPEVQMLDVKRIAEEDPPPAEIRSDTDRSLGGKGDALSARTAQAVHLIRVRVLQHKGEVVPLRFYVSSVNLVKFMYKPAFFVVMVSGPVCRRFSAHPSHGIQSLPADGSQPSTVCPLRRTVGRHPHGNGMQSVFSRYKKENEKTDPVD